MATIVLTIKNTDATAEATAKLNTSSGDPKLAANSIINYLYGAAGGNRPCTMDAQVDGGTGVAASGTLTLSSSVATDTCVVGNQTFTSSATPSGNNQFLSTGGDTTVAAAIAAKINAHPSLVNVVTATSALGVVTITAANKGNAGNMITLTGNAQITASAAKLAGGTEPTANLYHYGA